MCASADDRATFLAERKKMLQEWADCLDAIEQGGGDSGEIQSCITRTSLTMPTATMGKQSLSLYSVVRVQK